MKREKNDKINQLYDVNTKRRKHKKKKINRIVLDIGITHAIHNSIERSDSQAFIDFAHATQRHLIHSITYIFING